MRLPLVSIPPLTSFFKCYGCLAAILCLIFPAVASASPSLDSVQAWALKLCSTRHW